MFLDICLYRLIVVSWEKEGSIHNRNFQICILGFVYTMMCEILTSIIDKYVEMIFLLQELRTELFD